MERFKLHSSFTRLASAAAFGVCASAAANGQVYQPEQAVDSGAALEDLSGSCGQPVIAEPHSNAITVRITPDEGSIITHRIMGQSQPDGAYNYDTVLHFTTNGQKQCARVQMSCADRTTYQDYYMQKESDGSGVATVSVVMQCPAKGGTYPGNAYWQPPTFQAPWVGSKSKSTMDIGVSVPVLSGLAKGAYLPLTLDRMTVAGYRLDYNGAVNRELLTRVTDMKGVCKIAFDIGVYEDQATATCTNLKPEGDSPLPTVVTKINNLNGLNY